MSVSRQTENTSPTGMRKFKTARTYLIIPDFDRTIIGSRQNVRLVTRRIIVDAVDAALVTLQRVVRHVRAQAPYLNGSIQRGTGEGVGIFGVDFYLHHVVRMPFKHLCAVKAAVPVPEFDGHIIRRRQDVREGGVHFETTNVISVRFEFFDLFHRVVIEDAHAHIVRGRQEPLLARDKLGATHGQIGHFKGFGQTAGFVIPEHDIATVQRSKNPWLRVVQVNGLDALRRGG